MLTADLLSADDRCHRLGYWSQNWQGNRVHPTHALRMAIDTGLMSPEDDPGQVAGDELMTIAAERGLDVTGSPYACAMNHAALADLIVTVLRAGQPFWERPEDKTMKASSTWVSSAFREPSGVRLRRVVCVDRYTDERKLGEIHSWRTIGEQAVYELPMTLTFVLIGNMRDGRHSSPWTKGFLHPKSRYLRIRKKSGESLGGDWIPVWREECDHLSRDKWIDQMKDDGVMHDVLIDVNVPLPCPEILAKVRALADKKLSALRECKDTPEPSISMCDWPTPCVMREACWQFTEPSERLGFIPISTIK